MDKGITLEDESDTEQRASDNQVKSYSVSEAVDAVGYGKFQIMLTIAVGFAYLSDAMEMMILAVIGPALQCSAWNVSTAGVASLTTAVFLAMTIASPIWGFISDTFGRRIALIGSTSFLFLFGLAAAFSPSFTWLLIFRFFCGCFLACMPQCVTLLLEYLPSYARGRANLVMAVVWACGGSVTVLLGWGTMEIDSENGWRLLVGLCATPLLAFLICSYWVPESLLYLVQNKCNDDAQNILMSMSRVNKNEDSLSNAIIYFDVPHNDNVSQKSKRQTFFKFFSDLALLLEPKRQKLTILLWTMWFIYGMLYYGALLLSTELLRMWDQMCLDTYHNNVITVISSSEECIPLTSTDYLNLLWTSLAEFPGAFIALYVIDIIGRKKTFVFSGAIMTFSLSFILFGCSLSTTSLTVLLFFTRGSCLAYGWCCWIYTPEVYPTYIRAIGFGTASTFTRIGGMITPYIAQVLVDYSWRLSVIVYTLLGVFATLIPIFLPIETMGLDLDKVDHSLNEDEFTEEGEAKTLSETTSLLVSKQKN